MLNELEKIGFTINKEIGHAFYIIDDYKSGITKGNGPTSVEYDASSNKFALHIHLERPIWLQIFTIEDALNFIKFFPKVSQT